MPIYITGHVNPDLDSVASAIIYSRFLKRVNRYKKEKIVPVIPGDANNETIQAFKKADIGLPKSLDKIKVRPTDKFILVDHNERIQRHPKVNEEQIIEIIDHHKPNVNIDHPVRIDIEPCGSTSVFIYQIYKAHDLEPSKISSMLILMAILSDTQGLKSHTTTKMDTNVAYALAKRLDLKLKDITMYLFEAKADIKGLTPTQIVKRDPKVYEFNNKKVFVGQIETLETDEICNKKEKILEALKDVKKKDKLDQAYLMITDLDDEYSMMFCPNKNEIEITVKAFEGKPTSYPNIYNIGNRMSRKSDIIPELEKVVK